MLLTARRLLIALLAAWDIRPTRGPRRKIALRLLPVALAALVSTAIPGLLLSSEDDKSPWPDMAVVASLEAAPLEIVSPVAGSTGLAIFDPYATPGTFTKGQLHVHSTWSFDGWTSLPPGELADEYRRLGYGFIVVTDHNVVAYTADRNRDASFVAIPGFESTSDSGHITALFANSPANPELSAQERIDAITGGGGMAVLGHPGWRIGYSDADMRNLRGFSAVEIYNGMTMSQNDRLRANIEKWHQALNAKGPTNPIYAVAVDDAHEPRFRDTGWVAAKLGSISAASVRQALRSGAFYASNGPSFSRIGVLDGAIAAASPEAETIRFIDQDLNVVSEGPPSLASYRPSERDRFIRIEAIAANGTTAWSQPFWLG